MDKCRNQTAHAKRPLDAFLLWAKQERSKICKGKKRVNHENITSVLGKKWMRELSEEERQAWKLKADESKAIHKYRPRRTQKKETVEQSIHTDNENAAVFLAAPACPAREAAPASLAPHASAALPASPAPHASPAPPVPPLLSQFCPFHDIKTFANNNHNMEDIEHRFNTFTIGH